MHGGAAHVVSIAHTHHRHIGHIGKDDGILGLLSRAFCGADKAKSAKKGNQKTFKGHKFGVFKVETKAML